jgi:hypothetical protein
VRCTDAILAAFLSHPNYRDREDLVQIGVDFVLSGKKGKEGNWAFAFYLPKASAWNSLTQCLPEINRAQSPTGLWGRISTEKISYMILRALKHAAILPNIETRSVLRSDPYKCFSESNTLYGFLVRRNIVDVMLPNDELLQRQFISQITAMQREDGSWGGTVVMTSLKIECLFELGLNADKTCMKKGAAWILSQFRESIERWRPKASWGITAHNMFTSDDLEAEFSSAQQEMPEENPVHGCFMSLPFLQTGLALRTLVRLGFSGDKRVRSAYATLLDIQLTPERKRLLGRSQSSGNWCAIGCRRMLEEKVKSERKTDAEKVS